MFICSSDVYRLCVILGDFRKHAKGRGNILVPADIGSARAIHSFLQVLWSWQAAHQELPVKGRTTGGAWVAQSVKRPTSAQVKISRLASSRPPIGLSAVWEEPTLDPLSPSLSAPPPFFLSLKNKH